MVRYRPRTTVGPVSVPAVAEFKRTPIWLVPSSATTMSFLPSPLTSVHRSQPVAMATGSAAVDIEVPAA